MIRTVVFSLLATTDTRMDPNLTTCPVMEGVLRWADQEHSPNTVLNNMNINLANLQAAAQSQGLGSI
jgi:hypothetical protein